MKRDTLDAILAARADKRPLAVVTALDGGAQSIVDGDGNASGQLELDPHIIEAVHKRLRDNRSGPEEADGSALFVQVHNPPLRLIIVGAVHIAQALAPIASLAGYEVTVVDPRRAFNTDERFPVVALNDEWPDDALEALAPDNRTAVVTLTHDPKFDDPALAVALKSDVFYIGSLGSRRTHAGRLERLAELGFDEAATDRIHGHPKSLSPFSPR
jgi:xanthine dehydrogenase accessory factor